MASVTVSGSLFGVGVTLCASEPELLEPMLTWLPLDWQPGGSGAHPVTLALTRLTSGEYELSRDGEPVEVGTLDGVLTRCEWALRNHIARSAPDHVLLHAGAVAYEGQGLIIPGENYSGKSTLVASLLAAGASYYSDEYAVIDRGGLLHPFLRAIRLRDGAGGDDANANQRARCDPGTLGRVGRGAVPVKLVALARYRRDAPWDPQPLTRAESILELLSHCFAAEARAVDALSTLNVALAGAVTLKGERGDAPPCARALLARLGA